jgi:hypothetical protein
MNNIIPMDYEGLPVRFNSDGWLDATGIAATVLSAEEVASVVDDVHYMDLEDAAAEQALRDAIDERAADAALDAVDALDAPVAAYTAPAGTNPFDLSAGHFDRGESTAAPAPAAAPAERVAYPEPIKGESEKISHRTRLRSWWRRDRGTPASGGSPGRFRRRCVTGSWCSTHSSSSSLMVVLASGTT